MWVVGEVQGGTEQLEDHCGVGAGEAHQELAGLRAGVNQASRSYSNKDD